MGDLDRLFGQAGEVSSRIQEWAKKNANLLIVSHVDADGITSASIIARSLARRGMRFSIKIVSDMNPNVIGELKSSGYENFVICDLGAGMTKEFGDGLGDDWQVIDHHQIPQGELNHGNVFNPWQYDMDGGREVSAAGMAYVVAVAMDPGNKDLSWIAVVGALADRQDQGNGHGLTSVNRRIVQDGQVTGVLSMSSSDLIIYGRESKPVHVALASTYQPFIPGLSGNKDACLALLKNSNLRLKEGDRWRSIADLDVEEKKKLIEALIPYFNSSSPAESAFEYIIGEAYSLIREEAGSPLRDAREFGTVLNSCGRLRKSGVGVSLCFGDRGYALEEAQEALAEYGRRISRYLQAVLAEDWRLRGDGVMLVVSCEGLVEEEMLGAVSSTLSSQPEHRGKVIVVKTMTRDGDVKFSTRKTIGVSSALNLGLIMKEGGSMCGGVGGGHDAAAGARVPKNKVQEFLHLASMRLKTSESEGKGQSQE